MVPPRRRFLNLLVGGAALVGGPRLGMAQSYPLRPVRVIVPFAPGGQTDVVARLVAQKLSDRLGKQFYVENAAVEGATSAWAGLRKPNRTDIQFCSSTVSALRPIRRSTPRSLTIP